MNNEVFLQVMENEGPVTIITVNAQPASVVNTWMSYIKLDLANDNLYIPAAGMHSIEHDFEGDSTLTLTVGSKKVIGTEGPGAGFHIYGQGSFLENGAIFEEMKAKFPWIRKVLKVKVTDIQQKI
ncbi:FMN-binding protein [Ligilactobacillus equi DPC 6820]|uniref:FMN-binding protein n=2 Tax=Ligilactobacillus equi TaxID=137357 RepID=V7HZ96_9LACO|nr:FMN-binding protein [Ligilactobacillus equi DPC 6820]